MRIDGGRMICAPTGFRWTVGAAISHPKAFSLLGRRCRAYARRMRVGAGMAKALQRAGQCPAPTKGEKRFYIRRRGGCPHPPALEGTPFVGHGLPDAPFRLPAKRRRGGTLGCPPSADGGIPNGKGTSPLLQHASVVANIPGAGDAPKPLQRMLRLLQVQAELGVGQLQPSPLRHGGVSGDQHLLLF